MPKLSEKLRMPPKAKAMAALELWAAENLAEPAGAAGYPDVGAALSAALAATGELVIPDDLADAALAVVPGAQLFRLAKKSAKVLKKAPKRELPPGLRKDADGYALEYDKMPKEAPKWEKIKPGDDWSKESVADSTLRKGRKPPGPALIYGKTGKVQKFPAPKEP